MARYNVEYNGKWACFTSVADGFITEFMDKIEYENWRKHEYGVKDYEPAEKRNIMSMHKAVSSIRLNRNHENALITLLECGLPEKVCEKLLYDLETTNYCPKLNDNNKYECPNCHKEIKKMQKKCDEQFCWLEFVWRI